MDTLVTKDNELLLVEKNHLNQGAIQTRSKDFSLLHELHYIIFYMKLLWMIPEEEQLGFSIAVN